MSLLFDKASSSVVKIDNAYSPFFRQRIREEFDQLHFMTPARKKGTRVMRVAGPPMTFFLLGSENTLVAADSISLIKSDLMKVTRWILGIQGSMLKPYCVEKGNRCFVLQDVDTAHTVMGPASMYSRHKDSAVTTCNN